MGSHPLNLLLRFLLEITALVGVGMWAWRQAEDWLRFVLVIGLPLLLAAIWGIFAVPDDPSRSGAAPVVTPGLVRLFLELAIFAVAVWCLYDIGWIKFSLALGIVVALHYGASYDRIRWLLAR